MQEISLHESSSDESSGYVSTVATSPESSPLFTALQTEHLIGTTLSSLLDSQRICNSDVDTSDSVRRSNIVEIKNISCIGAGYVGGPTAAVIALHNPSVIVEVLDKDQNRINQWNSSHLPIHEPNLDHVVRATRDGSRAIGSRGTNVALRDTTAVNNGVVRRRANLVFTTDSEASISKADMILIAVNTPTKTFGLGAGVAANLTALDGAVKDVARYAQPGTIIVEKSTVPCGTAQRIRETLSRLRPGVPFEVLSNPEFLSEGTAIENLLKPDRVLIGSSGTASGQRAAAALASVYNAWVPQSRIVLVNAWSSELAKLVANAMLAQRISSINSISAICEKTGADIKEIAKSVGLDPRIGPQFLKAGLGFGGSCFRKDIASLTYLAKSLELEEVAHYWSQVIVMNDLQRRRFAKQVIQRLDGNLVGKKIAILGFAFKGNTGDTRESPAVEVIQMLYEERPGEIAIFDAYCREEDILREIEPTVMEPTSISTKPRNSIKVYINPYEACSQADAVLILTDCNQFHSRSPKKNEDATADTSRRCPNTDVLLTDTTIYHLNPLPPCISGCIGCKFDLNNRAYTEALQWARIVYDLKEPKWVFDGRGVLDVAQLEDLGAQVESIGRKRTLWDA